jgi:galactokinase
MSVAQLGLAVQAAFAKYFGAPALITAYAPGRVNLIGEHTDYNEGFVLPCAIPFGTAVAMAPRDDGVVHVFALDLADATDSFAVRNAAAHADPGHWSNHVRGIAAALQAQGHALPGANIVISGDVPQGAGLSSSASLGVALARGWLALAGQADPKALSVARAAQWAENHVVGCQCGIMDQLVSVAGQADHALLIDCRDFSVTTVPLPADAVLLIVHSGVTRGLVDSAYNDRRAECARAASACGVSSLRDVDMAMIGSVAAKLDPVALRRARHVVSENARTLAAAAALRDGDLVQLGDLIRASHASMRDDFAITLPPIDTLAALMNDAIGDAGGARMTGGGFGGCLVAILAKDRLGALEAALAAHWARIGEASPLQIVVRAAAGAALL